MRITSPFILPKAIICSASKSCGGRMSRFSWRASMDRQRPSARLFITAIMLRSSACVILRPKPAIYLRLKTSHFEGGFPFVCSLPSSNLGGDDDGESAQDGGDSSNYGTSGARLVAAADRS